MNARKRKRCGIKLNVLLQALQVELKHGKFKSSRSILHLRGAIIIQLPDREPSHLKVLIKGNSPHLGSQVLSGSGLQQKEVIGTSPQESTVDLDPMTETAETELKSSDVSLDPMTETSETQLKSSAVGFDATTEMAKTELQSNTVEDHQTVCVSILMLQVQISTFLFTGTQVIDSQWMGPQSATQSKS